ncbi:MAG: ribonuclease P protein component [bacterium]|nr:ribonuclease P protein component [bacterium]
MAIVTESLGSTHRKPSVLTGSAAFAEVLREGRRVRRGGIILAYRHRDCGPPRIGLVAGRQVGGAVVRNRAKRRVRAVLRELPLAKATDYVFIVTSAVATVPFSKLGGWIRSAVSAATPTEEL